MGMNSNRSQPPSRPDRPGVPVGVRVSSGDLDAASRVPTGRDVSTRQRPGDACFLHLPTIAIVMDIEL